jgi:predicted unusual protein kinase regulating ubiquinone biosynthesis (AarF/ABC1/UbiB family)
LDESGSVWQKFGQMLSTQEELIGKDLAIEMQKCYMIARFIPMNILALLSVKCLETNMI